MTESWLFEGLGEFEKTFSNPLLTVRYELEGIYSNVSVEVRDASGQILEPASGDGTSFVYETTDITHTI